MTKRESKNKEGGGKETFYGFGRGRRRGTEDDETPDMGKVKEIFQRKIEGDGDGGRKEGKRKSRERRLEVKRDLPEKEEKNCRQWRRRSCRRRR